MHCLITAGPTYEPLDAVRRLTNFSTGRLGSELALFLSARGHTVSLLIGRQATWHGERPAGRVDTFTTTADLRERLHAMASEPPTVDAVFHAAAVSDFAFGQVWSRSPGGELTRVQAGKLPTRQGALLAELVPTPKILSELRGWFPRARLVGWKYEVDGGRSEALLLARRQLDECRTDACVLNGPAYGPGFGLLPRDGQCRRLADAPALFKALEELLLAAPGI